MTFEELRLNKQLLNAVSELGFTELTEIQAKAIPQILAGHDILGIAQTGTGKTAAYLLPLLYKLKYAQGQNPRALILVPTRELAVQIGRELLRFSKYTDLRSTTVYGGTGFKTQTEAIKKGIDILIATPARCMDIYLSGNLILKQINTLVIDEADRMMDMGFMPQIRRMLEVLPRKRQNLLFSATMPEKVVRLSEEFLEYPMRIEVTPHSSISKNIDQVLYEVPNLKTKINLLEYLLNKKSEFTRVIVFLRSKKNADNIYKFIKRKVENEVRVIHANKAQNARLQSIEDFKNSLVRILVATDVAARGIDISNVSHVINFDVPLIYEEYVHRIGRTGRINQQGKAITFANKAEMYHIKKIEKLIGAQIPIERIPDEVIIEETSFEERQKIEREIDLFKKKENPDYKGAFHEKKAKPKKKIRKK